MDPFSSKGLLKVSALQDDLENGWHGFKLEANPEYQFLRLAEVQKPAISDLKAHVFKLQLNDTTLEPIDDRRNLSSSSSETQDRSNVSEVAHEHATDIWDVDVLSERVSHNGLLSWDRFKDSKQDAQNFTYLSESQPDIYDVLLSRAWKARHDTDLRHACSHQFYNALTNLMLGRGSLFFTWNPHTSHFDRHITSFSISGLTAEFTHNFCDDFIACGSLFRRIKGSSQSSKQQQSTLCALRSSALGVLHAIEQYCIPNSIPSQTLLQLHDTLQKCATMLHVLRDLLDHARSGVDERRTLTAILTTCDQLWISLREYRPLISLLAEEMLEPAVRQTLGKLRLCTSQIGAIEDEEWVLSDLIPEHSDMFSGATESLSYLETHSSSRPRYDIQIDPFQVLVQDWSQLLATQHTAEMLETSLKRLVYIQNATAERSFTYQDGFASAVSSNPFTPDFDLRPTASFPLTYATSDSSTIGQSVLTLLSEGKSSKEPELSPIQALRMSLSPFIEVQHRLSSYRLLRTLFLEHDLVAHVGILHSFQLFGSSVFANRLSEALFDVDQNSAEGLRKTGLTAGLRLEDRENWPPASSELRLVLMGLLSDTTNPRTPENVLACMSFTIREMPDAEMELCRDVHSIHALDFLKLAYAPPDPILELIVTPAILEKYDRIFSFLLVLLRLHVLSQNLVASLAGRQKIQATSEYRKFSIDLHHFTSTLIDFDFNVAIYIPWTAFSKHVHEIGQYLVKDDYESSIRLAGGVAQLRRKHEQTLDEIWKTLMMKSKQARVHDLTHKILALGLEFASKISPGSHAGEVKALNHRLSQLLRSWLGHVVKASRSEDPALQRLDVLLLSMDFVSYYSSPKGTPATAS